MRGRISTAVVPGLLGGLGFAVLVLGPSWGLIVVGAVALACVTLGARSASRAALAVAAGLVAFAAVASVLEASVASWNLTFASSRPVAGGAAAVGATLAMVGILLEVVSSSRRPAPRRPRRSTAWAIRSGDVWLLAVVAGASAVVVAARLVLGPTAIEPALARVVANVSDGVAYTSDLAPGSSVAPLTPVVLLVSGVGARALGLAAVAAVVICAGLLRRGHPAASVATASLVAAVMSSTWSQPLPVALAAALVAGALVLVRGGSQARAPVVFVGGLLGLALLADPTTIIAACGVCLWVTTDPTLRSSGGGSWIAALGTYLAFVVVAIVATRSTGATPSIWWTSGGPLGDPAAGWLVPDGLAGAAVLIAACRRRFPAALGGLLLVVLAVDIVGRSGTSVWGWASAIVAAGAAACVEDRHPSPATTAAH